VTGCSSDGSTSFSRTYYSLESKEEGWRGSDDGRPRRLDRRGGQQHLVGKLQLSPAMEEGPVKFAAHQDSSRKREGDKRITGADGSTMNPRGGTVHHGREKQKSVQFTTSRRGRCEPEAKVGWCAPILCGGQGERGCGGGCRR
jgi:hypothetical protein